MSSAVALPAGAGRHARRLALRALAVLAGVGLLVQGAIVIDARPAELLTGVDGMADIVDRSIPPELDVLGTALAAALETFDMALLGTAASVVLALPLAALAAENVTPARPLYIAARGVIAVCRVIPDLIWALLFVAAVGLGPFSGCLAIAIHSIGMLGRLFAERIEDIDMAPVEALVVTGATRAQVITHAVIPGVLPALIGVGLYRLDENLRSSTVLGLVGAGGIGFEILSAMNLFQYRTVATLLIVMFALIVAVERVSAGIRRRVQ